MYDVSKYENLYFIAGGIEKTKKVGFFGRIMDYLRGRDTKLIEGTIDKKIKIQNRDYTTDKCKHIKGQIISHIMSFSKKNIGSIASRYDEVLGKIK